MSRKKNRISVKEMRFRNDPMIRFYEKTQDWLQERGRPVVIAVGVIAGLVVLYTAGYYFFEYRDSKAATAFAEAFDKYKAPVLDSTTTDSTPQTGKTYTDEKTKWQESADAFEALSKNYPSFYGTIGRYYAGVSYLHLDRDRGRQLLEQAIKDESQPTSDLARMALAESYAAAGETDKAIPLYEKLLTSTNVPNAGVQRGLGLAYERAGDKQKAGDAYFEAAKAERATGQGGEAEKRLAVVAPERVKDLPPPDSGTISGIR